MLYGITFYLKKLGSHNESSIIKFKEGNQVTNADIKLMLQHWSGDDALNQELSNIFPSYASFYHQHSKSDTYDNTYMVSVLGRFKFEMELYFIHSSVIQSSKGLDYGAYIVVTSKQLRKFLAKNESRIWNEAIGPTSSLGVPE